MSRHEAWIFLALGAMLWVGASVVAPQASRGAVAGEELMYYPSGKLVREASLGYSQAAASLTWLRTVQYYGEHVRGDRQFDMMYHLCDVVTDLDPQFVAPYTFGSYVMFTESGRPDRSIALLEKGREKNPESWELCFETGFIHYLAWRDVSVASRYFNRAAILPGAPEYTSRFAAFVSAKAGEIETSILMWQEVVERTKNPEVRRKAQEEIDELRAQLAARDQGNS